MPKQEQPYLVEAEAVLLMMAPGENRLRAWLLDICDNNCLYMTTECFRQLRDLDAVIANDLKDAGLHLVEIDSSILAVSKEIGTKINGPMAKVLRSQSNEPKMLRIAAARIHDAIVVTIDIQSPISTQHICTTLKIETLDPRTIQ
jgi:hypothetical protein